MAHEPRPRRPGFTIPGNASAAARKGQAMGACRRWTREDAQRASQKAADLRSLRKTYARQHDTVSEGEERQPTRAQEGEPEQDDGGGS